MDGDQGAGPPPPPRPRPTTWWEIGSFVGVFLVMFLAMVLLRGCFVLAARAIEEQNAEAKVKMILARRRAEAMLKKGQQRETEEEEPKAPSKPKSRAAKKAD